MARFNDSTEKETNARRREGRIVAIVVDPELGDQVRALQSQIPVWVVNSPTNAASWDPESSVNSNSALYRVKDVEARIDNLIDALVDVDGHFGPESFPKEAYSHVRVIGLALSREVEARMRQYGFTRFRSIEGGFEAEHRVREP